MDGNLAIPRTGVVQEGETWPTTVSHPAGFEMKLIDVGLPPWLLRA